MIGDRLDEYTFEKLMTTALAEIPDNIDKRQGSIIYDALAVAAAQLAQGYIELKGYYQDTYALTAQGTALDYRVAEAGVVRKKATYAVLLGEFLDAQGQGVALESGPYVSAVGNNNLIYRVMEPYMEGGNAAQGKYLLECVQAGTIGNSYLGQVLPVTHLNNVAEASLVDVLIPASDEETDESLRARYLEAVNSYPFGGNVAQYRQWIGEIEGVGAVQIYPVWNGGGTVKCSIVDGEYMPASVTLIQKVQEELDPENNGGEGLGLAPIGHVVTVGTPSERNIQISADVILETGTTLGQVQQAAREAIEEYFYSLRSQFGAANEENIYHMDVYRARILAAILDIDGVENVANVLLDGEDQDLQLEQEAAKQSLPVVGTVTLHEI